jgi:glycosyltransferase involved in cell wall biosynthesis
VRALIVSYSGVLGGAERLLLDFAEGIEDEAIVAAPPGPLLDEARAVGLAARPLRARPREVRASARDRVLALARLAGHAREIRALARAEAPDVLVGWGMRSALAAFPAAGTGRQAFVFQHNDVLPGPLIGRLVRAMSRRADAVSALSRTIAADLDPAGRLGSRLHVVVPGVDLARFRPAGPPAAGPRAVLIGAVQDWKRPDLALEIAARAARALPGLRLELVGGTLDAEAEQLVERLRRRAAEPDLAGRVSFSGYRSDATAALDGATCLLHCADREPLGMVLIEALACGRPVVAPADGGPLEVVDDAIGRLYTPGDAQAGADALVAVAGNPEVARRMGAAARELAERRFDRASAHSRYGEMLRAAVAQSSTRSRSLRSPR